MPSTRALSKTLSYWLRHRPEAAGLVLDAAGWTDLEPLLAALSKRGTSDARQAVLEVVRGNDKQRFELSSDGTRIRARQGHSVPVTLDWPQVAPPEQLFHGTVAHALPAIRREGLRRMGRHHVHLSPDCATAATVGDRRGAPIVLTVRTGAMAARGQPFFLTANGVWLVDHVAPEFIVELAPDEPRRV